ncbi:hypothetical protein ACFRAQ_35205 [Nocardia sp. NPDC056611]|uniref:hypothetical protein n=1 Tax=Nocardia sp. NPDC056611 TaxID=3345877 RepID=UPI00366CB25A
MNIMSQSPLPSATPLSSIDDLVRQMNNAADQGMASLVDASAKSIATERAALAEQIAKRQIEMDRIASTAAADAAKLAADTQAQIMKSDADSARWQAKAIADEQQITSPYGKVALIKKISSRADWALFGAIGIGIGLGALNIQRTIATHGAADPLTWFAFGMEAMVSVPIIITMVVATLGMRLGESFDRKWFAVIEAVLLLAAIGLNSAPHLMAGDKLAALQFGAAPALMAFTVALHGLVSALLAKWLRKAATEAKAETERLREVALLNTAYAAG